MRSFQDTYIFNLMAAQLPFLDNVGVLTVSLRGGLCMNDPQAKSIIDERKAAALLGLTPPELRWFSRFLGLGHRQENGDSSLTVFTFDELKLLSSAAAASAK